MNEPKTVMLALTKREAMTIAEMLAEAIDERTVAVFLQSERQIASQVVQVLEMATKE